MLGLVRIHGSTRNYKDEATSGRNDDNGDDGWWWNAGLSHPTAPPYGHRHYLDHVGGFANATAARYENTVRGLNANVLCVLCVPQCECSTIGHSSLRTRGMVQLRTKIANQRTAMRRNGVQCISCFARQLFIVWLIRHRFSTFRGSCSPK